MKKIYIVGYRGTRMEKYTDMVKKGELHPLLYAGHVGIEVGEVIYGFRPTKEAIELLVKQGINFLKFLKNGNEIEGMLHDDSEFFKVADRIADAAGTHVYQIEIEVSDEEYEKISSEIKRRMNERKTSPYRFPLRDENGEPLPMEEGVNNCATYPRTLGIPIPEPTGQISKYVTILKERGTRWVSQ